jgi:hypothetical protein
MLPSAFSRLPVFCLVGVLTAMLVTTMAQAQTQALCTFRLFDLPDNSQGVPSDINDSGTIVGSVSYFSAGKGEGFTQTSNGNVTYYCAPGANCDVYDSFTGLTGINNAGTKVGSYAAPQSNTYGFMLKGSTFHSIQEPNAYSQTWAVQINSHNTVIGYYDDSAFNNHGFERSSDGTYTTLDYPGVAVTAPEGINSEGEIVGYYNVTYYDSPANGFTFVNGEWTTLNYPGASGTILSGISDAGVIVGAAGYASGPGTAFLYENGEFKVIAYPNSYSTNVSSISADGLIVGITDLTGPEQDVKGFAARCK